MRISRHLALSLILVAAVARAETTLDTAMIERVTGVKGTWNEKEKVFRVAVPRNDLAVVRDGVRLTPPTGLTSWAAFQGTSAGAMVMGDLVLREDQVAAVMDAALQNGLEVTALHTTSCAKARGSCSCTLPVWAMPKRSPPASAGRSIACGKRRMLLRQVPADIDPARTTLDPARSRRSGNPRRLQGRRPEVRHREADPDARLPRRRRQGVNTWAAFAGSDAKAVVDGDFAKLESELQSVLKALRRADTRS